MGLFDKKEKDELEVPPKPLPAPPKRVLDYAKEGDRFEINRILEDMFKKGITDSKKILDILAKTGIITNLYASQVSAIYGNYRRWKEKPREEPKPEESKKEPDNDTRIRILESGIIDLKATVGSQKLAMDDFILFMKGKLEETPALEVIDPKKPPQQQPPELSPELQAEKERMEALKIALDQKTQELSLKTEQVAMTKQAKDIMKKLQTADDKLNKNKSELDRIDGILQGEEQIEESPPEKKDEIDDLTMDAFKILKEINIVNPRTLRNVIEQTEGIKKKAEIKIILYGGEPNAE